MKMEQTECSETLAYKIHTPENHKKKITFNFKKIKKRERKEKKRKKRKKKKEKERKKRKKERKKEKQKTERIKHSAIMFIAPARWFHIAVGKLTFCSRPSQNIIRCRHA